MGLGLRDLKRAVIEREAVWWAKDWLRRAQAGEKGETVQKAMLYVLANKVAISFWLGLPIVVVDTLVFKGVWTGTGPAVAASVLSAVVLWLNGAGAVKSDGYYKDRQADQKAIDDGNNR